MIRRVIAIGAMLIPLGCSEVAGPTRELRPDASEGPLGGVSLVVEGTQFVHGDVLEARLVNGGSETVGYNLCSSARERLTAEGEWQRIEAFRICTAALYLLEPGESETWREPIEAEWGSGTYRLVTAIYPRAEGPKTYLASAPFQVSP